MLLVTYYAFNYVRINWLGPTSMPLYGGTFNETSLSLVNLKTAYCIAGKFGMEFNLVVWRISVKPPN